MKKQLTQLMPTLVVMVLILALTVATYNISLRQEEEECFNRLENASETMVQSIKNRVTDDLNYLRLIGKDFSNEDHLPTYEEYKDRLSTFEDVSLFLRQNIPFVPYRLYQILHILFHQMKYHLCSIKLIPPHAFQLKQVYQSKLNLLGYHSYPS